MKILILMHLILLNVVYGQEMTTMNPNEEVSTMTCTVSIRTKQACKYFGDNHFCYGCLIRENVVISAASCFIWPCEGLTVTHNLNANNVSVIAAPRNRLVYEKDITQVRYVNHLITHPKYNMDVKYNIALLILNTPLEVTEYVKPFTLMEIPKHRSSNYRCESSAVGRMYYGGPLLSKMRTQNYTIYTDKACSEYFIAENLEFPRIVICTRNNGYCHGDSGGPLLCSDGEMNYLLGVIIQQFNCDSKYPTVYVPTNRYYRWIMKAIRSHDEAYEEQLLNLEDTEFGEEPFFRAERGCAHILNMSSHLWMSIACFFIWIQMPTYFY